ncbi:MAG: hypothetical protein PCFJNLEI_02135 [Verrucomicrobiae bacterium]|nr:hypothetical protein [Verrucomicrobiae bacterium]
MALNELRRDMRHAANPTRAVVSQRFFKTGPGEYAEGDRFLGLTVPQIRSFVKQYRELSFRDTCRLLRSPIHEERLLALLLLVEANRRGDATQRRQIYRCYLANTRYINNWDLVDSSAEHIVGSQSGAPLSKLARSASLWERRIAIIATFHFIKRGEFAPTLRIARQLLGDEHDLIHKAVGWMLREVGKRDLPALEGFLQEHHRRMPRTMLRYAIERLPERRRQWYLLR